MDKTIKMSPELSALVQAALRGKTSITVGEFKKLIFCQEHGFNDGVLVSICEEDGARLYKCGCEQPPQNG